MNWNILCLKSHTPPAEKAITKNTLINIVTPEAVNNYYQEYIICTLDYFSENILQ